MRILLGLTLLFALNLSSAHAANDLSLPYKQAAYTASDQNTSIDAKYPRFLYPKKNARPVKLLNAEIRRLVHRLFKKFLSGDDVGKAMKKSLASDLKKGTYKIRFKVVRADDDYVSIKFKTVFDQAYGEHGLVYVYTFNYDLKNSKTINLDDIVGSGGLEQVLTFCDHDLKKKVGRTWHEMSTRDLAHFSFDKENLYFNFNSYKLTDNSVGSPQVKIPFQQLEGLKKGFEK